MDARTKRKIARAAKEVCETMADVLQQEYRIYRGRWWLYSLGSPRRPLTAKEINWHKERGNIPK